MKKVYKNNIEIYENELDFKFNKIFTKKERILFDFLLSDREIILGKEFIISIKKLKKILLLEEVEDILKIFQKLSEKNILYTIFKFETHERSGTFSVLSSYYIEDNIIKINFTDDFKSIFQKNSYFQKNSFDILLFFQSDYAILMYNFFKFNLSTNKPIKISVNKLKTLLNLENSYDRFYDFEKIILRPVFKEISNVTKKKIIYNKIKNKDSSNSKIIGLTIEISDFNEKEKSILVNEILEKIEFFINDSDLKKYLWNKIFNFLDEKSHEYIMKNIIYSIAHHPKNEFKAFFEEAIELNYAENRFKNKIKKFSENFKMIEYIERKNISLAQLHSDLFKILANLKFNYLTLNPEFLKSLQSLKNRKELEYFDNNFIVFAEYNEDDTSYIVFLA